MIVGQNTILQCKVYGNPAPDVRWTKDGEAVNIADQRISVSFTGNTSSLTIVDVAQAEQGLYRCVANNSVNTTTSYPGMLTVHCEYLFVLFSLDAQLITIFITTYMCRLRCEIFFLSEWWNLSFLQTVQISTILWKCRYILKENRQ